MRAWGKEDRRDSTPVRAAGGDYTGLDRLNSDLDEDFFTRCGGELEDLPEALAVPLDSPTGDAVEVGLYVIYQFVLR
jgi:hypothetical protein